MDTLEWMEFSFQLLGALGSLATVGAFIYLFRRDKDKQAQIDKLAAIFDALRMQLYQDKDNTRLQFLPSLKLEKHTVRIEGEGFPKIVIVFKNHGKPARVLAIKNIDESYLPSMSNTKPPYDLKTGEEKTLTFSLYPKTFDNANLLCDLIYSCELNYTYKATIKGDHETMDVLPGTLLTHEEIVEYKI